MLVRSLTLLLALAVPAAAQGFANRTFDAGLGAIRNTNGVAVADYDRDGDLDVYLVSRAAYDPSDVRTWSRLYSNNGDGSFTDVTLTAGIDVRLQFTAEDTRGFGYEYVAAWGDYDNDGFPDLFLGHMGPDQLFHNNGDGTFTDVTEAAGVSGSDAGGGWVTSSGVWFDHDRDGDLDLYVGSWWDYGPDRDLSNRLYRNEGDGTFVEIAEAAGLDDPGATWTALPFDADGDGWTDLYLTTDVDTLSGVGPNKLYLAQGDGTYRDATAELGVEDTGYGMGLALGDADGNGLFDLYLTNVATPSRDQRNPLWLQSAPGVYQDVAPGAGVDIAGWGWGTEFLDIENDGDLDLVVVTGLFDPDYPNYLFQNDGAAVPTFTRVDQALGVADDQAARGLAVFDYDNDGDQDLLVANLFEPPFLYANEEATGAWLQVDLEGSDSNRDGLGARVEAWVGGRVHARLHHGAQYLAQNLGPVHIGLGDAARVDSVVVRWPSGRTDRVGDVPVDQRIAIAEGRGAVRAEGVPEGAAPSVTIGPNPASGLVTIRVADAPAGSELEVFDALGRRVHRAQAERRGPQAFRWSPDRVPAGVYLVRLDGRPAGTVTVIR